jgi:AraC-like DNA-binding protein
MLGETLVYMSLHQQVRLARLLLDQGYNAPITIEDLSREVALSPYYLIRVFRHVYKQTPHQYLVGRRYCQSQRTPAELRSQHNGDLRGGWL